MAPIIKVSDSVLEGLKHLGASYELVNEPEKTSSQLDFIHVPSIGLDVSKQRVGFNKNWFDAHKEVINSYEGKMMNPMEFVEFLKYSRDNFPEIYNEITEVRNPWRAEWLDADFKVINKKLHMNYNHALKNGILTPQNSEILDEDTLMKDKTPGISLEDFINENHTKQGLPSKKVKSGDLYYWHPREDNNSVARFYADDYWANLSCYWDPSNWYSILGVRVAKQHK